MLLLSQVTISSVVSVEWCVTKERLHIVWENKVFIIFWFWLFYLQKRGGEGGGGGGRGWRRLERGNMSLYSQARAALFTTGSFQEEVIKNNGFIIRTATVTEKVRKCTKVLEKGVDKTVGMGG